MNSDEIKRTMQERAAEVEAGAPDDRHIFYRTTPESSSAKRFRGTPPPIPYMLNKFGVRGTAVLLSGAGGAGKTWLELLLAASFRLKTPLLGDELAPQVQGNTVAIFPEDPEIIIHQRMKALCDKLGYAERDHLLDGIFLPAIYGEDMSLVTKGKDSGFTTTETYNALIDYIKRCPEVVCVILDPLNLLHGVDLEADPAAAQYFASRMSYLAKETNTLVIVAHHTVKGDSDPKKFDLEIALHVNNARGTGATMGGFRGVVSVAALPELKAKEQFSLAAKPSPGEYIAAKISKNNYGPLCTPFFLHKDIETGLLEYVRTAKGKRNSVEKTHTLNLFVPLVVKKVAELESEGKQLTKVGFTDIYSTDWKKAGNEKASKSTLSAAINKALLDGYLIEEPSKNASGRSIALLSIKGALPLPDSSTPGSFNSWLQGDDNAEDEI
ncbi:AAA family ATPase [Desulfovibrio sp. OttesenSCG-928-G15]|nr:AAA family ATPase [Desulfovibrio sp. OttesenSCG-928-G15]